MRNCRAALILTFPPRNQLPQKIQPATSRASGGAAPGPTTAGHAGPPFDCGSNRSDVTTTSAFAWWLCSRNMVPRDGWHAFAACNDCRESLVELAAKAWHTKDQSRVR